jgi:hypothetical protein
MRRINHRDFGLNSLIVEPRVIPEWKAFWRNEKEKEYTKKISRTNYTVVASQPLIFFI